MGKLHSCTSTSSSGFPQRLCALAAKATAESVKLKRVAVKSARSLLPEPAAASCYCCVCLNTIWKGGSVILQKGKCSLNGYCRNVRGYTLSANARLKCAYASRRVRQRALLFPTMRDIPGLHTCLSRLTKAQF